MIADCLIKLFGRRWKTEREHQELLVKVKMIMNDYYKGIKDAEKEKVRQMRR